VGTTLAPRLDRVIQALVLLLALLLPVSRRGVTITASLVILLWLLQGRWLQRWQVARSSPVLLALLAFVGVSVVSLAWSADLVGGLDYLAKYRYLLLAGVVATTITGDRVARVVDAFLAGSALSLLWSFGIAAGLIRFGHGYPEHPAPSMNHLDYSMFLAMAGLLALVRLAHCSGGWRQRATWGSLALASVAGLLVNIGRSGQLAFFVALAALLARHLPGPRLLRPVLAAAAAGLLLAAAYLTVPTFRARADAALDEIERAVVHREYVTNQGKRIASWIASVEVMRGHPLLGTGVGDTIDELHRTVREQYPELEEAVREYRHLHNQYFQVGVELGLVGLVALVNVFLQLLRFRTGRAELDDMARAVGWVFLVGCLGDPFLRKQLPLVLFAVLCGLVVAAARQGTEHADVPEEPVIPGEAPR